jgi:7-cyano-7-deazaguanine synthase
LLSGGLDSCVCATWAREAFPELAAVHASYGQRTEERERRAFQAVTQALGISRTLEIDLSHLGRIGGSSLTDPELPVPEADLHSEEIPSSYVPFRNAHFLSVATSWAEVLGFDHLVIGAVEEDGSGYPDCRRSFYDAFEVAIDAGTRPETRVAIVTPLIELDKARIVAEGIRLKAPLQHTWSCYQANGEEACGHCDSCALRLRGFAQAGVEDPIPYAPDRLEFAFRIQEPY